MRSSERLLQIPFYGLKTTHIISNVSLHLTDEYDFSIALELAEKNNGIFEIEFPQSCVLYIRNHREHSLPKHHEAIVKFADGQHNKKLELYRFNYTYRKDCNLNQSAYSKKVNF